MLVYQRVNQLILSAEINLVCQLQKQENLQETKARPLHGRVFGCPIGHSRAFHMGNYDLNDDFDGKFMGLLVKHGETSIYDK